MSQNVFARKLIYFERIHMILKTSSALENLFFAHLSFRENVRLIRRTSWSALSLIDSIFTGMIDIIVLLSLYSNMGGVLRIRESIHQKRIFAVHMIEASAWLIS